MKATNMKKMIGLMVLAVTAAGNAFAAIPNLINFQGRLCDADGVPVTSVKPVRFQLFNVENGGSALFTETQNIQPDLNGIYNTLIGETASIAGVNFNQDLWIELTVDGNTLSPRYRMTSSPYALWAKNVDWSGVTNVPVGISSHATVFSPTYFNTSIGSSGETNVEINTTSVTTLGPTIDSNELPVDGYAGVYMPINGVLNTPVTFLSSVTINNSLGIGGGFNIAQRTVSATTTLTGQDHVIFVDTTPGIITINLPTAIGAPGRQYIIKKKALSLNIVLIDAFGSQTIDGITTCTLLGSLTNLGSVTLVSDGANWFVVASAL